MLVLYSNKYYTKRTQMKKSDLDKIEELIIFNKKTLLLLDSKITKGSFNYNISRWISAGSIIKLKRGVYISVKNYERYRLDPKFLIFIANTLSFPSYVTAEAVLQTNGILTESTFGITSFSLRAPVLYKNKVNTFKYNKIKESIYTGYLTDYFLGKKIYFATKAKALFDYLYLKTSLIPDALKGINLIEELRLNLDSFISDDFAEFTNYKLLVPGTKLSRIINNIIKNASVNKFTKIN